MFPLKFSHVFYAPKEGEDNLIKDIDIQIEQPGTLVVLGPNGAGKSLFLRLAHQLLQPSKGVISWGNENQTIEVRAKQSMVFQQPVMLNRSVFANLSYALQLKSRAPAKAHKQIIYDTLANLGLAKLANSNANSLSLGEQQILAIARAIITKPKVLFLDEPTASLDPSATYQIEQLLANIAESNTKLIMATHDLMQAKRLANDILFIHQGSVLEYSDAKSFFKQPVSAVCAQFVAGELLWS